MQDRNRPTLRLRLPVTPPAEARRPAVVPPPSPPIRPAAYVAPRRMAPAPLDACSRAIMQELAALGLADAEEA